MDFASPHPTLPGVGGYVLEVRPAVLTHGRVGHSTPRRWVTANINPPHVALTVSLAESGPNRPGRIAVPMGRQTASGGATPLLR